MAALFVNVSGDSALIKLFSPKVQLLPPTLKFNILKKELGMM